MIIRTYGNLKKIKEFFYLKISKENDTRNLLKVNNVVYGPFGLLVFFLGYLLSIQKVINIYRSFITGENETETVKYGISLK